MSAGPSSSTTPLIAPAAPTRRPTTVAGDNCTAAAMPWPSAKAPGPRWPDAGDHPQYRRRHAPGAVASVLSRPVPRQRRSYRQRPGIAVAARLGNPALRPVLTAPGHHLPTHPYPAPAAGDPPWLAGGAGTDPNAPAAAGQLPPGQHPDPGGGPGPTHRHLAPAAGGGRLPAYRQRLRAWRVRRPGRNPRYLPDGGRTALPD